MKKSLSHYGIILASEQIKPDDEFKQLIQESLNWSGNLLSEFTLVDASSLDGTRQEVIRELAKEVLEETVVNCSDDIFIKKSRELAKYVLGVENEETKTDVSGG